MLKKLTGGSKKKQKHVTIEEEIFVCDSTTASGLFSFARKDKKKFVSSSQPQTTLHNGKGVLTSNGAPRHMLDSNGSVTQDTEAKVLPSNAFLSHFCFR